MSVLSAIVTSATVFCVSGATRLAHCRLLENRQRLERRPSLRTTMSWTGLLRRARGICKSIDWTQSRGIHSDVAPLTSPFVQGQATPLVQSAPLIHDRDRAGSLEMQFGGDCESLFYRSFEDFVPVDTLYLPGRIFNAPVRADIVHRVVHWQLAKRRAGTGSSKTRSEVSGSGKKIRPQKGTGRSRQGARTSPIFRGGGRAQGPKPRDFSYPLPHDVCRNGLRSALTSKFMNGKLWIVEQASLARPKTSVVIRALDKIGFRSVLVIDHVPDATAGVDPSFRAASFNIKPVLIMSVRGINVYDLLSFDMTVLSLPALRALEERFEKYYWLC